MTRLFEERARNSLVWLPEYGVGYHAINGNAVPYDAAYFANYQKLAATEMGRRITEARVALVERWATTDTLVDVGIGSGQFIEERNRRALGSTFGWDINPIAQEWLTARNLKRDPINEAPDALTFWDSLEHIPDPEPFFRPSNGSAIRYPLKVFVTAPIFRGPEHILSSKHFKPGEHCWYWTRDGLVGWMKGLGFDCVEHNTVESLLGREDSHSFAFVRSL